MTLSADAQAILLLCSHVGLPAGGQPAPLTLREWNALAGKIRDSDFKRPGALLDVPVDTLAARLEQPLEEAGRLARLLQRGAGLAVELERLQSLGIWVLTRADDTYPVRYRERLKHAAPAVLFGAGIATVLGQPGLAVVGSREVNDTVSTAAVFVGNACAGCELVVYSGGARGVDGLAMTAAKDNGGRAVGILADSLEKAIRDPSARGGLLNGSLTLLTPYAPKVGFSVGAAMGRNKLIYALADCALVVGSDAEKGGTWAGATEALRHGWVPVFVFAGADLPEGNRLLLERGRPFPWPFPRPPGELRQWLAEQPAQTIPPQTLF